MENASCQIVHIDTISDLDSTAQSQLLHYDCTQVGGLGPANNLSRGLTQAIRAISGVVSVDLLGLPENYTGVQIVVSTDVDQDYLEVIERQITLHLHASPTTHRETDTTMLEFDPRYDITRRSYEPIQ